MRTRTALIGFAALATTALAASPATAAPPHAPDPDGAELTAWARLPADTFVPGSEPSGHFTNGDDAAFPGQPVQGFSAVHALADGEYLAMSDNGFGVKENSQDFLLAVHRIDPDTDAGTIERTGGFTLSDPHGHIDWPIWRDGGCEEAAELPDGYACPEPDRTLTGWDFDLESMQVARDGTLWFGEEFGPYLLHTDAAGRLLEAPIPTPGVSSPSNPDPDPAEPNLRDSKGFEGMAISPNGQRLYPMLEGATQEDIDAGLASDLRVYDVKLNRGHGTAEFTGDFLRYRMEDPSHALGDFIAVDAHRFLVIERDNGSGEEAEFKRIYLADMRDRDGDGYLDKHLLVDLMDLPNPQRLGTGDDPFTFPYVTIEDVEIIDDNTIAVLNDNNYPATGGRGDDVKDINEYLEIDLPSSLRPDHRVLPAASPLG